MRLKGRTRSSRECRWPPTLRVSPPTRNRGNGSGRESHGEGSVSDLAELRSSLRIRGGYRSNSESSFQNSELNQNVTKSVVLFLSISCLLRKCSRSHRSACNAVEQPWGVMVEPAEAQTCADGRDFWGITKTCLGNRPCQLCSAHGSRV